MARSNKGCWKICGWLQFVSKDEEQNKDTSREVNDE